MVLPLAPFYALVGHVKDTTTVFLWISIRDSAVRGMAMYHVGPAVIAHKRKLMAMGSVVPLTMDSAATNDSAHAASTIAAAPQTIPAAPPPPGSATAPPGSATAPAISAAPAADSAEDAADSAAMRANCVPVYGTVEPDGSLIFCGFSSDGNMQGCFQGKIIDDSIFQGKWFSLINNMGLACQLYRKDTVPDGVDTTLRADKIDGTYSYHMGDAGPAGGIIIHKTSSGTISIDLGCAGPPPDYASAMVKSPEVPFDGETATYKSPGKAACELRIRVFKDFVVIGYVGKLNQCNYGASVEGVFARTH
jgi:hypothetical protein